MTDPQSPAPPPSGPTHPAEPSTAPPPPRTRRWWHGAEPRGTPDRPCLNCGDATVGNYCPTCGQRKVDVRISLRGMFREVMDDQLSLNSALPRTLAALFFHPGRLTREYVQGRIMRYIPPFRLYLVSSLLFFVLLPLVADPDNLSERTGTREYTDSVRTVRIADSVLLAHARRAGEDTVPLARAVVRERSESENSIQFGPDPDRVIPLLKPLARRMKRTEARLNGMPRNEALTTVTGAFVENAPVGVFVMMPLFAMILKFLYLRRKRFYVEHFVFALHVHAFAFLVGVVTLLARPDLVDAALTVWFLVYLFLALKRVYGQGIFRTLAKYVALGVCYAFLLVVGVTATVLMTALSL